MRTMVLALILIVVSACSPSSVPAPSLETVDWAAEWSWAPDGAITKIQNNWYFSSGREGVMFNSSTGESSIIIGPSNIEGSFDKDYAAPGSVVEANGNLYMFYHGENHGCGDSHFPFHAGIGMATSQDGQEWTKIGQVLSTWEERPSCSEGRASGVGYPSVVVSNDYVYMFFVSWTSEGPDAVHVARCEVADIQNPNCWGKYFEGNWDESGIRGRSTPVIERQTEAEVYLAAPQVQLVNGQFVGVFETNLGFVVRSSSNGIEWQEPREVFTFPTPHLNASQENWYSYPSLIKEGEVWWLYMARQNSDFVHTMHRIQINLPY